MFHAEYRQLFNRSFIKVLLVLLLVVSVVIFLKVLLLQNYPDFSSYYYGAATLKNGGNPYLGGKNFYGAFRYPPFDILFFFPFTFFPFIFSEKLFTVFSLLCFFFALFLLMKILKLSLFNSLGLILLILVTNFFPAKYTLGMGQANNIVLLAIVLFIYFLLNKKQYIAGVFLALAITLKLFPVLFILYLLIQKQWKVLWAFILTIIATLLLVYIFLNHTVTVYFFQTILPNLLGASNGDYYYNQALSGFLARETSNVALRETARIVIGGALVLWAIFTIWKKRTKSNNIVLLSLSLIIVVSLIINPFSWQHYYVWTIISLLITFWFIKDNHPNRWLYMVLFISYLLMAINLKNPLSVPAIFQSHVLYGSLLLYGLDSYLLLKGGAKE